MWKRPQIVGILAGLLILLLRAASASADIPVWLPRYDLDIRLDIDQHWAHVRQRVTFTNRHQRPAGELVFNAHSHYQVPDADIGFSAKMLEILRLMPSDALDLDRAAGPPLQIRKIILYKPEAPAPVELPFYYAEPVYPDVSLRKACAPELSRSGLEERATTLVVSLPGPVGQGESVAVEIDFDFRLPQKQGRWGQWMGVTTLSNWLPVLAVYDECGWQPTPFIPWHQPWFNEAGIYTARVTLPCDQQIACSTAVAAVRELGGGLKQIDFMPYCVRDFAFLCSARYREFVQQVGPVQIRCVALPEHEFYAREMVQAVCEALPVYSQWFGTYPYPQFTIAESYFGWNGNECGGLVMIDERIFGMPHVGVPFVEYLVSHEFCHQWWYNAVGTNGYCETWMDEALAVYFSHLLMDKKHGRDNTLLNMPQGLGWLPNIHRESYRYYSMYGTMGRGEATATVQAMPKYGHMVNLLSMCYDRGGKIVGMIADRLGETAFLDFMRIVYAKYQFRILRVDDFRRELNAYTGQNWDEFFQNWLYKAGLTDWCVEKVKIDRIKQPSRRAHPASAFPATLQGHSPSSERAFKVTVLLHQKADYNEPTVLGFCLDGSTGYQIRIPIHPQDAIVQLDDPPTVIETLPQNRVRVEILLPCKPTQITVDPDQILVDRDPSNNYWKQPYRIRFAPFYTMIEETDVTTAYDRWNVIFGPGIWGPAYDDPWYTRSTIAGVRAGLYRTQEFDGGAYFGYRTDDRNLVAGVDGLWDHWPWPRTQVGFNAEHSFAGTDNQDGRHNDRGVIFGRYVFQYGSSLYLPPIAYLETYTAIDHDNLPLPRQAVFGTSHFDQQTEVGVHYHLDYLTPYWDPEGGFRIDTTYTNGVPILGERQPFEAVSGQFSMVKGLPEWLGPLSQTRLAARIYGAAGLPSNGELFTMGGGDLFRGFDLSERQGNAVWVGSLEWRVPVIQRVEWDVCDHAVGVRNVSLAAFYDVGDTYVNGHSMGPVAQALGGGVRVDIAWLSLIERMTLRFDVAQTINTSAPLQFWFGVRMPF
jgi:hypothetical protein